MKDGIINRILPSLYVKNKTEYLSVIVYFYLHLCTRYMVTFSKPDYFSGIWSEIAQ